MEKYLKIFIPSSNLCDFFKLCRIKFLITSIFFIKKNALLFLSFRNKHTHIHFISVLFSSYFSLHFLSHYLLHFILSFYFFLCLSSFILNLSKNWNDVYYFPFKCDQWVIIFKFLKYVNSKFFFGRLYKNCFIRREVKSTF